MMGSFYPPDYGSESDEVPLWYQVVFFVLLIVGFGYLFGKEAGVF